jgi:hypothetical protein
MSDSDDAEPVAGITAGVRNILRRASEHLPGFRRPSITATQPGAVAIPAPAPAAPTPMVRARSLSAAPTPFQMSALSPDEGMSPRSRPVACPGRRRNGDGDDGDF